MRVILSRTAKSLSLFRFPSLLIFYSLTLTSLSVFAIATPSAAIDPEFRDYMIEQLRASEGAIAYNYCSVCYESIAYYTATRFYDYAGLLSSNADDLNPLQPLAELTRLSALAISEEKYEGMGIPEDQHLAECSTLLKGYAFDFLRLDAAETDPRKFLLLPSADSETRRAALQAYIEELQDTDRYNCEETFRIAEGGR